MTVFPLILFYMLYLVRRSVIKSMLFVANFCVIFLEYIKTYMYIYLYTMLTDEIISSHLLCAIIPWLKENSKATQAQMGLKFPSF